MMVERRAKRKRWCECKAWVSEATENARAKRKVWGSEATENANGKHGAWGSKATKIASEKPEGAKRPSRRAGMSAANVGASILYIA